MVVVMMIMMIIYRVDNGNNDDNIYDSDNDSYGDNTNDNDNDQIMNAEIKSNQMRFIKKKNSENHTLMENLTFCHLLVFRCMSSNMSLAQKSSHLTSVGNK